MTQRYKKYIMWLLYALLFLAVMLVQNMLFGRLRVWGVKLNLMPVVIAALVWSATGADDGSLSIVSFTLIGIFAGWLCDSVFSRRIWPALFLSLGAVFLHELALFLLKYYLESASFSLLAWVPATAALSQLTAPALYLLAKAIGKAGGN